MKQVKVSSGRRVPSILGAAEKRIMSEICEEIFVSL